MGLKLQPLVFLAMLTLVVASAFSYELQTTGPDSKPLRWPGGSIELSLSDSIFESEVIGPDDKVRDAIVRAASAWSDVSGIEIVLSRSKELSISPLGRRGDGISLITIAQTSENLLLFSGINASRPAVTRLFYDRRGNISEADIVLNPYFSTSIDGSPGSFDLESTLVHEIGHALGLGHSDVLGASMNSSVGRNGLYSLPFTVFRTLSMDDIAGIRALYGPATRDAACCGSLAGTIHSARKSASGFLVWLEDEGTGATAAVTRSSSSGTFRFEGIGAGLYRVFMRGSSAGTRTEAFGTVLITKGKTSETVLRPESSTAGTSVSAVGFNGQLSSVAVPINAGRSFKIYVAGVGEMPDLDIGTSSPGINVDRSSFEFPDYGDDVWVAAFVVDIGDDVPEGDYSILIYRNKEIVGSLIGALAVEKEPNPWTHRVP